MTPKIKVCGMREPENIISVGSLYPSYMGFIFYEKSPRNAFSLDPTVLWNLNPAIIKVGVFVNMEIDKVKETARRFDINTLQLHGEESPDYCTKLKKEGFDIIKAVGINSQGSYEINSKIESYQNNVDFILFDTKGETKGGNGIKFDWKLLEKYSLPIPFLISGGIQPEDSEVLKNFSHPFYAGMDINSRFEEYPGHKNIRLIENFISKIRGNQ